MACEPFAVLDQLPVIRICAMLREISSGFSLSFARAERQDT